MTAPSGRTTFAPYLELRADLSTKRRGDGGSVVCEALSRTLDGCLALTAAPLAGAGIAVVAVGGYGRSELCLQSDVDLMLLHRGELPRRAIEFVLYPLWDSGLRVGHAVRSVREALSAVRDDVATLTALLDARTVFGDAALVQEMLDGIGNLLRRDQIACAEPLRLAERERRTREPFQLQEADLKDGRGGLRSLLSVHWERRRRFLAGIEPMAPGDAGELDARSTLLAFRNAVHSAAGRPFERFVYELRPSVAAWLGLEPQAAEGLLYRTMRKADATAASVLDVAGQDGGSTPRVTFKLPGLARIRRAGEGGAQPSSAGARPLVLAADALNRKSAVLTAQEANLIANSQRDVWTAADRTALLRLLSSGQRGWEMFQTLDKLGWVAQSLPEWAHVVAAPQAAPFHLHPVDVHLWRAVSELTALLASKGDEAWTDEVAADLGSPREVLLATWLHDIGKGLAGDHSSTGADLAVSLLRRLGFGPSSIGTVSHAVRHHLLLPNTAMRRDIDDPRVIQQVAGNIPNLSTLRILYLLAVADARATGPLVWNPWKRSLLGSLFARVAGHFEAAERSMNVDAEKEVLNEVLVRVGNTIEHDLVRQHLAAMPQGYSGAFSIDELLRHLGALIRPPQPRRVTIDVQSGRVATNVVIIAQDQPGFLTAIAGVFALHNISVLDGRFYTRADGLALDVFNVQDALGGVIDARHWSRLESDLERSLRDELPLIDLLKEQADAYHRPLTPSGRVDVLVAEAASEHFGVIEIHCGDAVGLLHTIAGGLFAAGLDIRMAKIDTRGQEVVDTFYLRTIDDAYPSAEMLAGAAHRLNLLLQEAPA